MRNELQAALEDAICYHELQAKSIQEAISKTNHPRAVELYEDAKRYNETALSALRDMLEREQGCWHCHGIEAHEIECITEVEDIYLKRIKTAEHIPYRYCASCGRPLTKEGGE